MRYGSGVLLVLWATKDLTLKANADSTDYCATVSGAVEKARVGPFVLNGTTGGYRSFAAIFTKVCIGDLVAAQISCTNVCFETLISTLTILHCALLSRDKGHAF